ncbi:MAG: hypothetical protein RL095_1465 [Verrucomicrobiota bacterium]|jgi:lipoprotein-releasing system ATP-binding protein
MNALEIRNLSKSYVSPEIGKFKVLDEVSLVVPQGHWVMLFGGSGSGKSTLLHLAGLLDHPDQGRIFMNEREVTRCGALAAADLRRRYIGFIFQSFQLMPELTAEENVALPGLFGSASTDAVRRRARELLDQVGLSHRLSHRPGSLSGGEQQRVALARALINDPKLILADEPTGNLDPDTAAQIIANFDLLCRQQGRSLLMVSHNHGLASHADSVLYLRKGCLVENEQQARHGVITPQA